MPRRAEGAEMPFTKKTHLSLLRGGMPIEYFEKYPVSGNDEYERKFDEESLPDRAIQ